MLSTLKVLSLSKDTLHTRKPHRNENDMAMNLLTGIFFEENTFLFSVDSMLPFQSQYSEMELSYNILIDNVKCKDIVMII